MPTRFGSAMPAETSAATAHFWSSTSSSIVRASIVAFHDGESNGTKVLRAQVASESPSRRHLLDVRPTVHGNQQRVRARAKLLRIREVDRCHEVRILGSLPRAHGKHLRWSQESHALQLPHGVGRCGVERLFGILSRAAQVVARQDLWAPLAPSFRNRHCGIDIGGRVPLNLDGLGLRPLYHLEVLPSSQQLLQACEAAVQVPHRGEARHAQRRANCHVASILLANDAVVTSSKGRQSYQRQRRLQGRRNVHRVEVRLQRSVRVAVHEDHVRRRGHGGNVDANPVPRGERCAKERLPQLRNIRVEVEMRVSGPLGAPQEGKRTRRQRVDIQPRRLSRSRQEPQVVVQVDPYPGLFSDHQLATSRCRVPPVEFERRLRSVLGLQKQRSVRRPVHPRDVELSFSLSVANRGPHPDRLAQLEVEDCKGDARILRPGKGISVIFLAHSGSCRVVFATVHDAKDGDVSLLHPTVRQAPRVPPPPEAVGTLHLLLRDEVREAVGDARVRVRASCELHRCHRAVRQGQIGHFGKPQLAVCHKRHAAAIRRHLRVDDPTAHSPLVDEKPQLRRRYIHLGNRGRDGQVQTAL
eukprot:scaffold4097_cov306-Pinguiococcus_pyrenoidosus.AAC.3